MYCEFLIEQNKVTLTRQTFDRALMALPVTQVIYDLMKTQFLKKLFSMRKYGRFIGNGLVI